MSSKKEKNEHCTQGNSTNNNKKIKVISEERADQEYVHMTAMTVLDSIDMITQGEEAQRFITPTSIPQGPWQ